MKRRWAWLAVAAATPVILAQPSAPRPALLAISADVMDAHLVVLVPPTTSSGTDAARTPAPRARVVSDGAPVLAGRASWYAAAGAVAAAGPGLRRALGRHWRGTWVRVTAGHRSVDVRLADWCECYAGTRGERLIDLADDDFAVLAPLAAGVVRVRITTPRAVVPPATDVEP